MAIPKTAVSTLQEFCSKNKIHNPDYANITDEELGHVCKVTLDQLGIEEMGSGRSKRDAKHAAAAAALKKIKSSGRFSDESVVNASVRDAAMSLPPVDMVAVLRDFCVQRENPLPQFELVCQCGTPNAPNFTMLCQIASIQRYGASSTKKDAKQLAAFEMLNAIKDPLNTVDTEMEIVSIQTKIETAEEERYRLFKTYRQLIESGEKPEDFGVRLDERHDFFTRFKEDLKKAAQEVLKRSYESERMKAYDVLEALKINPKIRNLPSVSGKEMLFIELDCKGFDTCFAGFEEEIYPDIIQYFKIMLV